MLIDRTFWRAIKGLLVVKVFLLVARRTRSHTLLRLEVMPSSSVVAALRQLRAEVVRLRIATQWKSVRRIPFYRSLGDLGDLAVLASCKSCNLADAILARSFSLALMSI